MVAVAQEARLCMHQWPLGFGDFVARGLEVQDSSGAADREGNNDSWHGRVPGCHVDDVVVMDRVPRQEALRVNRPESDGAVRIADSDSIAIDPSHGSRFDGVLISQTENRKWPMELIYSMSEVEGKREADVELCLQ